MTRLLTDSQLAGIPDPLRKLAERLEDDFLPRPPRLISNSRLVAPDAVQTGPIRFGDGWMDVVEHRPFLAVELCLEKSMTGAVATIVIHGSFGRWQAILVETTERSTPRRPDPRMPDRALGAMTLAGAAYASGMILTGIGSYPDLQRGFIAAMFVDLIYIFVVGFRRSTSRSGKVKHVAAVAAFSGLYLFYMYLAARDGLHTPAILAWLLGGLAGVVPWWLSRLIDHRVARWWGRLRTRMGDQP